MKPFITGLVIGALLAGTASWRAFKPAPEKADEESKSVERKENESGGVKLDGERQTLMGIRVEALKASQAFDQSTAYGRVLNAAELPLQLAEITTAEVALKGSRLAFDRVKKLNAEAGTVSEQKVEEAEEALKKDEAAMQAARTKLLVSWGPAVADRADLKELAEKVATGEAAFIRLDFRGASDFGQAKVALQGDEGHATDAKVLGPASQADPVTLGTGVVCLVNGRGWTPGAAVVGWQTGAKLDAVSMPRSALVRHQGLAFVYIKHEDEFTRQAVELVSSRGDEWLVRGPKAGNEVVVQGAQQLLSEELKDQTEPE